MSFIVKLRPYLWHTKLTLDGVLHCHATLHESQQHQDELMSVNLKILDNIKYFTFTLHPSSSLNGNLKMLMVLSKYYVFKLTEMTLVNEQLETNVFYIPRVSLNSPQTSV